MPLVFVIFSSNLHFLDRFLNNAQIIFCENPSSGFHTEEQTHRRTDGRRERETERESQTERQAGMTKLIVAVRSFTNAPKNVTFFCFSKQKSTKETDASVGSYMSDNILYCSVLVMSCLVLSVIYIRCLMRF